MRTSSVAALCGILLAGTLPFSKAQASCASTLPMSNYYGGYLVCTDVPAPGAFAYALDDPAGTNSGAVPILCTAADGGRCPAPSGVAGDARVTIASNWLDPGMIGCPVSALGPQRLVIVVGTGSKTTGSAIVASLSGADPYLGYAVEGAQTSDATGGILPLAIEPTVGVVQLDAGYMLLHFSLPHVRSDCDPGTLGRNLSACVDAFSPAVAFGQVYTRVQPCGAPIDIRRAVWTGTGVTPDATGNAAVGGAAPPAGQCRLVGATTLIDGRESEAVTGFLFDADCVDRDGDGSYTCPRDCDGLLCHIDCDDTNPNTYPGAPEICDGRDNDCNGVIDDTGDRDGDGVLDCADNCPSTPNPGQEDFDLDTIGDLCDNCSTIPNRDQNPCVCSYCGPTDVSITFSSPLGKGSGVVSWESTREVDVVGYNVVVMDQKGTRTQLNPVLIPCEECITGVGHTYTYIIPKHKSGHDIFVEELHLYGSVLVNGPAVRMP